MELFQLISILSSPPLPFQEGTLSRTIRESIFTSHQKQSNDSNPFIQPTYESIDLCGMVHVDFYLRI